MFAPRRGYQIFRYSRAVPDFRTASRASDGSRNFQLLLWFKSLAEPPIVQVMLSLSVEDRLALEIRARDRRIPLQFSDSHLGAPRIRLDTVVSILPRLRKGEAGGH
jgi:hypothetical protein